MKSQRLKVKDQKFKSKLIPICRDYFLIVFLTFDFLFLTLGKVDAAELSLGISPPIIEIQTEPPAVINTPITIENHADETVTLEILLKPFTPGKGEFGEVAYLWDKNPPLIFQNIKVRENGKATDEIILAPRQKKNLSLHFDIPKGEPSSDYYFSVVFISKNIVNAGLSHSQIRGAIATNVLLSVGTGKSIGKIAEFSAPLFLEKQPVPFTIRLKNEGKHFITPQGTILITNIFGKTIGELNLLPVNILADTTRFQKTVWTEPFLFGPYTATLTIIFSDKGPILVETIRFLVLPMQAFIGLAIIVFIILGVKKRLKTHREH